jgi:hypothetical protein
MTASAAHQLHDVLRMSDVSAEGLANLLARFDLELVVVPDNSSIVGTYWGEPEAGLVQHRVFARGDTPVHSLLHEACHAICMTAARRSALHGDAGGDDLEESAVCYLQILLAENLSDVGGQRLMQDMDTWGYSFRLGCTRRWFEIDAGDARTWLEQEGLLTVDGLPRWVLRQA